MSKPKNDELFRHGLELKARAERMIEESGHAPYTAEERAAGIWTMTDAEFNEALQAAREGRDVEGLTA